MNWYMFILDHSVDGLGWCETGPHGEISGAERLFHIIKVFLSIIHIVVPIGLIILTAIDIFKHVINPDSKDGQKKIINRIISALVVFFVPTMVNFVLKLVEVGKDDGNDVAGEVQSGSCWEAWRRA